MDLELISFWLNPTLWRLFKKLLSWRQGPAGITTAEPRQLPDAPKASNMTTAEVKLDKAEHKTKAEPKTEANTKIRMKPAFSTTEDKRAHYHK